MGGVGCIVNQIIDGESWTLFGNGITLESILNLKLLRTQQISDNRESGLDRLGGVSVRVDDLVKDR
jgi:hypothetical protein